MNYRLDIRPDALADIEAAAQWYEDKEPALGVDFRPQHSPGNSDLTGKSIDASPARSQKKRPLAAAAAISVPHCLSSAA